VPDEEALDPVSVLIAEEAAYRVSADFYRDREFWLNELAGLPEIVSVSGQKIPRASRMAIRCHRDAGPDRVRALKGAARRLGTSFAGLLIAAAAAYVHANSGAADVVLGIPVIGGSPARPPTCCRSGCESGRV
jgi:hypothetical protein